MKNKKVIAALKAIIIVLVICFALSMVENFAQHRANSHMPANVIAIAFVLMGFISSVVAFVTALRKKFITAFFALIIALAAFYEYHTISSMVCQHCAAGG